MYWRPKDVTVQCCDCGQYYHTLDVWKFHTETTTHIQCRDVKEKVQFFTKDADFSSQDEQDWDQSGLTGPVWPNPPIFNPIGATVSCQSQVADPPFRSCLLYTSPSPRD